MGIATRGIASGNIGAQSRVWRVRSAMPQRPEEQSDEQLMDLLTGPKVEAALSALYDRHGSKVFRVGLKLLGDRSLAEELVQEVFLKVWRSSSTFDPSQSSFSTWLYRVTRNAALDLHRKRARKIRSMTYEDPQIETVRDSSLGPQETVEDSWLSWRVSKALEGLGAEHRQVIEFAYFRGLSQREISRRTGLPLGTVKSRTFSALKRLGEGLAGQQGLRETGRYGR